MRVLLLALLTVVVAVAGCSLPWRTYPVSSSIAGSVQKGGQPMTEGQIRLQVRNRENATLGEHVEHELDRS